MNIEMYCNDKDLIEKIDKLCQEKGVQLTAKDTDGDPYFIILERKVPLWKGEEFLEAMDSVIVDDIEIDTEAFLKLLDAQ